MKQVLEERPLARVGLLLLCAGTAALLMALGTGTVFFFDEWDFVLGRRGPLAEALLRPHNGHLSVVPVAVYRLLLTTVGLDSYAVYRLTGIAFHLLCVVLLFTYAARRVRPWVALAAAAILALLGAAWQDLLWPFQIGYFASLAAGLAAFLLADRGHRWWHAVCLGLSLASSGLGVAVLAGALVDAFAARDRRRVAAALVPAALYVLWQLTSGGSQVAIANVWQVPGYVFAAAAAATGTLAGLGVVVGRVLLVAAGVAGVVGLLRGQRPSGRALALAAMPVTFWVLTAMTRGGLGDPGASRYLYPAVFFLLLVGAEALRRVAIGPPVTLLAAGLAIVSVLGNASSLRAGSSGLRATSEVVRAQLVILECGDPPAGYRPDEQHMPQLSAGPYLDAVADLGSPVGPDDLTGAGSEARAQAERVAAETGCSEPP